jgi:4-amino-4-deoxy-L-arabinose transferase-like glycosyltransferase
MPAEERASRWLDALLLSLAKLGVSAAVLASGFRALSDDDYSRIVIAQGFAEAPKLDPSGTSWLPVPFWIYGTAFAILGSELVVARAVALVLGVLSVLLVWASARLLGASRRGAFIGALLAAAFPYSAWLGVATVPEAPTAALVLFAAATLGESRASWRALGAFCLGLACFSRYEAWPAAVMFAAVNGVDAWRRRDRTLAFSSLIALGAIALWILHGIFVHKNAWFFVDRVAAYRAALGGANEGIVERLLRYPLALLRFEPELAILATAAWLASSRAERTRYVRLLLVLGSVLAFTVAGELRGGTPTHHEERVLLSLWFGLAVLAGDLGSLALSKLSASRRWVALLAVSAATTTALLLRGRIAHIGGFADRAREISIGEAARSNGDETLRLAVLCEDYGYFAVMAGFGSPSRATSLDSHDPRARAASDPWSNRESLRRTLAEKGARWLVAPAARDETLGSC